MTAPIDAGRDSAVDKVVKLIPAEVAAAFMAINGVVPDGASIWIMVAFALAMAAITFFYLTRLRGMRSPAQLLFVCVLAFPAWVLNIVAPRSDFLATYSYLWAGLLILVSLLPPLFFPGSGGSEGRA